MGFSNQSNYRSVYYLKQYNDTYFRIIHVFKERTTAFDKDNFGAERSEDPKEVERISLSRTKRNIREICFCNDFQLFATFTINSKSADRFSLDECQNVLKKHLKAYRRTYRNFRYIIITEKHKNGAFHFHGMVKGMEDIYPNENGFLSSYHFDKLGYNSFSRINDYNKCCNYMTKYMAKDLVKNEHNQIYFCSRGLKKADKYEINIPFDLHWQYENDFVQILDSYKMKKEDMKKLLTLK